MNPGQPPVLSQKVPLEAQALMMQPEAVNMLKQVNGLDLISLFTFQMPFMLLPKDTMAMEKTGQKLGLAVAGGFIFGVFANVQIKRISMNFLKWPIFFRIPIRLGVMALPFLPLYPTINEKLTEMTTTMKRIEDRKNRLIRTKDLEEYFQVQKPAPKGKPNNKK